MTLMPLSHHMCMKKAHTKNAFTVAIIMATGNANACGIPIPEVTTVKIVNPINETNTASSNFTVTGWLNEGRFS